MSTDFNLLPSSRFPYGAQSEPAVLATGAIASGMAVSFREEKLALQTDAPGDATAAKGSNAREA